MKECIQENPEKWEDGLTDMEEELKQEIWSCTMEQARRDGRIKPGQIGMVDAVDEDREKEESLTEEQEEEWWNQEVDRKISVLG